jgi:hypothetical protein
MKSIQIALDFHSHFTNAVSFVPMEFSNTYRTIAQAHIGNPFSLSPTTVFKTRSQLP